MENRKTVSVRDASISDGSGGGQKHDDDDDGDPSGKVAAACMSSSGGGGCVPNYNSIKSTRSNASGNSLSTIFAYDNPALVRDAATAANVNTIASRRSTSTSTYNEMEQQQQYVLERTYDPHDFGNVDRPSSFWGTVFHLIYLSAGPGLLFVPSAFANVGPIYGSVFSLATVWFYAYNVHVVVWCEYELCKMKRTPRLTYPEVVFHAFEMGPQRLRPLAPYTRYFVYAVFVLIWWSGCAYGSTLAAENLRLTFVYLLQQHSDVASTTTTATADVVTLHQMLRILLVPLVGLAMVRKLSYLEPLSAVGLVLNYFALAVIVYYVATDPTPWKMFERRVGDLVADVPLLLGTVLISLNVTALVIPLKNEMKSPRKFSSSPVGGVLGMSYAFVSLAVVAFGALCSLKYGAAVGGVVVFANLPGDRLLAQAARVCYTLALLFIYPLLFYVSFDVVWNNVLKGRRIRDFVCYEYAVRAVLALLVFVCSYVVPNMSFFLSIGGTVGTSADSLIVPSLVQIMVARNVPECRKMYRRILLKNTLIAALGCLLMVAGIYDAYSQLFCRR